MKRSIAVALGVLSITGGARADEAETPPSSRGFQLALRTGVAIPVGDVTSATKMSDALSAQVPLILDIGAKPIRYLFIGAFLGGAVGGAAGQVDASCTQIGVSCTGLGFRAGLQLQAHLRPSALANPWFGYGFGYEIAASSGSNDRNKISNTVRGFELAHLMGGVDFRVQEYFGIGPFVDGAIGQYDVAKSELNAGGRVTKLGGDVSDKAIHAWLIFGVRAVLRP